MRGVAHVPSLRITPPWTASDDKRSAALQEIVIDPAQAFGTGSHATTRLCLGLLLEQHRRIVESMPSEVDRQRIDKALRELDLHHGQ